jgi:hypothetical protein
MLDYAIYFTDKRFNTKEQLKNIKVKRGQIVTDKGRADLRKVEKVRDLLTENFVELVETYPELFINTDIFKVYLRIDDKDVLIRSLEDFLLIIEDLQQKRYLKTA